MNQKYFTSGQSENMRQGLLGICIVMAAAGISAQDDDMAWAEDVDLSRIPEAVDRPVDFTTEVWPLLENHCLSCHGEKKPKSGFQIISRDLALESGDYGGNFVEGDGLQSPFLHFAAHAVEDMEMPPVGKGDPIPPDGLAVLRAWIDQGMEWDLKESVTVTSSIEMTGRIWSVDGNKNMFRQLEGFREDDSVGLSSFMLHHPTKDGGAWDVEASIWTHPDEYRVIVGYDVPEGGWFQVGAEQFLSFDSTAGGVAPDFPVVPNFQSDGLFERTHQNLWFEGGIKQDDGPNVYVGYNYQSLNGTKSILSWGEAADTVNGNFVIRSLRPASKLQDNDIHTLTLRVDSGRSSDLFWEDEARIDWTSVDERTSEFGAFTPGAAAPEQRIDRMNTWQSIRGSNSIRFEKPLPDQWLVSAGHSFSLMEGDSVFTDNTVIFGPNLSFQGPVGQGIVLNQHSQMANLNIHGGPWDNGFALTGGVQMDWLTQDGTGEVIPFPGATPQSLDTGWDQTRFTEMVSLKYTAVPKQTYYTDFRFRQMSYDQNEFLDAQVNRATEASYFRQQYTAGWRYRPTSKVGLHLRGRYTDDQTDYDHPVDEKFGGAGNGYSAFLRGRGSDTLDLEARVSWAPQADWRLESHYQWSTTDFSVKTDAATDFAGGVISPGGRVDAAEYDQHSAGSSVTWSPSAFWNGMLHGSLTHWDLSAYSNGFPGISPYHGWTWWVGTRWNWILNPKTDLTAAYDFSAADFDDGNSGYAFSRGLNYTWRRASLGIRHRINPQVQTFAEYALSIWDQPSLSGLNDFEAHGVYLGLRWDLQKTSGSDNQ